MKISFCLVICFSFWVNLVCSLDTMTSYISAKIIGYTTYIHYNGIGYCNEPNSTKLHLEDYNEEIQKDRNKSTPIKKDSLLLVEKEIIRNDLLILGTGLLLNIVIGTIGFIIIKSRKEKILNYELKSLFPVFLSLFWLRHLLVLIFFIILNLKQKETNYGIAEFQLASIANISSGYIVIPLGFISIIVLLQIHYYIKKISLIFCSSCFLGSILGYLLWFKLLGPLLLP